MPSACGRIRTNSHCTLTFDPWSLKAGPGTGYNQRRMQPADLFLAPDPDPAAVAELLQGLGFRQIPEVDRYLQQAAELLGDPRPLAEAAEIVLGEMGRSADPDAAAARFLSFLEHVPSPRNLVVLLGENPRAAEVLMGILGASPYLAQTLNRNPEYLYWLLERGRLDRCPDADYFHRQAEELTRPFPAPAAAVDALRRLRRREALRIGAQELLGRATLEQTVRQISDLAEALLHRCFLVLAAGRAAAARGFAVVALGKFGGRELNFSSDIDLLFVHADEADHDEMVRFSREYLRALSDFTAEGRLYRVDLRLRPMGSKGEIIYSESSCRQYYQNWADTTDRLALIKARAVAGDLEVGRRFVQSVQDFVFRRYLDFAAVEEIRWIKQRSDRSLRQSGEQIRNIKLGFGGIREVEFFTQSFQILYAGQFPALRTPNTLEALRQLVDAGFVTFQDFQALSKAYIFFRNLEHKLQLVHDLQTHSLPEDDAALAACARRMGYRETDERELLGSFRRDLEQHTRQVHHIYEALFETSRRRSDLEEIVLSPEVSEEEAIRRLKDRQVASPEGLLAGIRMLQEAPTFPASPSRMRNLLANLVPVLVEHLAASRDPRPALSRFDRFCEALGSRSSLYAEMVENPEFSATLLRLLESGEFLSETLIRYPELLDVVFRGEPPDRYAQALGALPEVLSGGVQERREALRRYKQREEFKMAVRELARPGQPENRLLLSELADACIQVAWRAAVRAHPQVDASGTGLVALGKLGGRELGFHSDLDLVFLFDDVALPRSATEFRDLLRTFREELQEYTAAGRAYAVDFRLRPEGRHTGEAVPLSQFRRYFEERAEPWERLAYTKARMVLAQDLEFDPAELVFGRPFTADEVRHLRHIRERKEQEIGREEELDVYDLKVGRGALLDVQFAVQFLQIQHHVVECNLLETISILNETQTLAGAVPAAELRSAVEFFFALESSRFLLDLDPAKLPRDGSDLEPVARLLGEKDAASLLARYRAVTGWVRSWLDQVLAAGEEVGT